LVTFSGSTRPTARAAAAKTVNTAIVGPEDAIVVVKEAISLDEVDKYTLERNRPARAAVAPSFSPTILIQSTRKAMYRSGLLFDLQSL